VRRLREREKRKEKGERKKEKGKKEERKKTKRFSVRPTSILSAFIDKLNSPGLLILLKPLRGNILQLTVYVQED
jgi:hypothetical protein